MCLLKSYFFVAFLTFGIGLIVTSAVIFSLQIPKVEVISDKIEIKYEESLTGVGSFDGIFSVTNNTNETVYYFGDHKNHNQDSLINQSGEVKFTENHKGAEEYELKSNESTYFWIPLPQNEKSFEAVFFLRTGDKRKEEIIVVEVQKQKKHQ